MLELNGKKSSGSVICMPEEEYYKMVRALRMFLDNDQQKSFEALDINAFRHNID